MHVRENVQIWQFWPNLYTSCGLNYYFSQNLYPFVLYSLCPPYSTFIITARILTWPVYISLLKAEYSHMIRTKLSPHFIIIVATRTVPLFITYNLINWVSIWAGLWTCGISQINCHWCMFRLPPPNNYLWTSLSHFPIPQEKFSPRSDSLFHCVVTATHTQQLISWI